MKNMRFTKLLAFILIVLFAGIMGVDAAEKIPANIKSTDLRTATYITAPDSTGKLKEMPIYIKLMADGSYGYCMQLDSTYKGGVTWNKDGKVDPGYLYILRNKPKTGDKDKDFYITQMAVWYYSDLLHNDNYNLGEDYKKWIITQSKKDPANETDPIKKQNIEVCKEIMKLYNGAKEYKTPVSSIKLDGGEKITFTETEDYFVSSEIKVTSKNISGKLSYKLTQAPEGSLLVAGQTEGTVVVKVPTDKVPDGYKATPKVTVSAPYVKYSAFSYYASKEFQTLLFDDPLEEEVLLSAAIEMILDNKKHPVNISKTDVTQSAEIPGATLVVKDSKGNKIEEWVSTNETHKIKLGTGEYSLTETLAPVGYKLSKTTIYFKIEADGKIYAKNHEGKYIIVDRVVMINELKDMATIAKKDKDTGAYVAGAKLVVKDIKGNVIKEYITGTDVERITLDAGEYTLSEVEAPNGYELSNEILYFSILDDGTLRIKNDKGEYSDTAIITFYNKKVPEVPVPPTSKTSTLLIIGGIALLIVGAGYARKTIKEY